MMELTFKYISLISPHLIFLTLIYMIDIEMISQNLFRQQSENVALDVSFDQNLFNYPNDTFIDHSIFSTSDHRHIGHSVSNTLPKASNTRNKNNAYTISNKHLTNTPNHDNLTRGSDFKFSSLDIALASTPGENFNPKTRSFTEDELKPMPVAKKSKKQVRTLTVMLDSFLNRLY